MEELEERMEVEKWRRRERTDMARVRVLRRRSNDGRRFSEWGRQNEQKTRECATQGLGCE